VQVGQVTLPPLLLALFYAGTLLPTPSLAAPREQWIPVVSHALESRSTGTVVYLIVAFDTRTDKSGSRRIPVAFPVRPRRRLSKPFAAPPNR
jgi:hypothetical protein